KRRSWGRRIPALKAGNLSTLTGCILSLDTNFRRINEAEVVHSRGGLESHPEFVTTLETPVFEHVRFGGDSELGDNGPAAFTTGSSRNIETAGLAQTRFFDFTGKHSTTRNTAVDKQNR